MPCDHCVDKDGLPCFPAYGLAPHSHTREGIVFSPRPTVPGFTPDVENATHGTWWCPCCNEGNPELDEAQACPS